MRAAVDDEAVPVLHQDMPGVGELGLFALTLAGQTASGSVVEAWVSFVRRSPWKSTSGLRPPLAGGGVLALVPLLRLLGRKLLSEAAASIRVPSQLKCSRERSFFGLQPAADLSKKPRPPQR